MFGEKFDKIEKSAEMGNLDGSKHFFSNQKKLNQNPNLQIEEMSN